MQKSKSYRIAQEHRELYDGLVKPYKLGKDLFESYGKAYSLKRDREDKDKDEDPPTGSDQGLKRRKTSKDVEPSKGSKSKESKSSSSKGTKSQPKSSGKSSQAEESVFETADTEMLRNQGSDLAYGMNNLKIDNLTHEYLVGPAFNLPKGTCRSRVELEYHFEECYKAVTDRLDWNNPEGHEYPFELSKPLPLIEDQGRQAAKYDDIQGIKDMVPSLWSLVKWYNYEYLEEIEVRTDDQKLYKFKEGDFPRLNLRNIEDMPLLLVQKKISNLEKDVIFELNVAFRMFTRRFVILKRVEDLQLGVKSYQKKLNITKPETFKSDISKRTLYTAYNNPQGYIYVYKFKRNRMDYLLKSRRSNLDKQWSCIMIKAIDKLQLERRLMRNLEKFVGGREYGEDFRLHKQTI
ncbi:hypothetical protein Tco_1193893 [Tanacetum coccineum]